MVFVYDGGFCHFKFFPVVMKDRKQVVNILPDLMAKIELATSNRCKIFQTDGGGEYISQVMKDFLASKHIQPCVSLPYEHQQNEVAENAIKQVNNIARALLYQSGLPLSLWGEAVDHASYLHNVTYSPRVGKTPTEAYSGTSPNLAHLRTFGCITYYRVADDTRKKLDSKANVGYYLGPLAESKAVRVLVKHPTSNRWAVVLARDVVTVERYLIHPNVPAMQFFER